MLAGAIAASTAFGAYAAGTQLSRAGCDTLWSQANPSGAEWCSDHHEISSATLRH